MQEAGGEYGRLNKMPLEEASGDYGKLQISQTNVRFYLIRSKSNRLFKFGFFFKKINFFELSANC